MGYGHRYYSDATKRLKIEIDGWSSPPSTAMKNRTIKAKTKARTLGFLTSLVWNFDFYFCISYIQNCIYGAK